jgi:archaellin
VTGRIGDGYGTPQGCQTGCLIAIVSALVVGAIIAAVAVGASALLHQQQQPTVSTSTRSTP